MVVVKSLWPPRHSTLPLVEDSGRDARGVNGSEASVRKDVAIDQWRAGRDANKPEQVSPSLQSFAEERREWLRQ